MSRKPEGGRFEPSVYERAYAWADKQKSAESAGSAATPKPKASTTPAKPTPAKKPVNISPKVSAPSPRPEYKPAPSKVYKPKDDSGATEMISSKMPAPRSAGAGQAAPAEKRSMFGRNSSGKTPAEVRAERPEMFSSKASPAKNSAKYNTDSSPVNKKRSRYN
jgi:hypothetical protein